MDQRACGGNEAPGRLTTRHPCSRCVLVAPIAITRSCFTRSPYGASTDSASRDPSAVASATYEGISIPASFLRLVTACRWSSILHTQATASCVPWRPFSKAARLPPPPVSPAVPDFAALVLSSHSCRLGSSLTSADLMQTDTASLLAIRPRIWDHTRGRVTVRFAAVKGITRLTLLHHCGRICSTLQRD